MDCTLCCTCQQVCDNSNPSADSIGSLRKMTECQHDGLYLLDDLTFLDNPRINWVEACKTEGYTLTGYKTPLGLQYLSFKCNSCKKNGVCVRLLSDHYNNPCYLCCQCKKSNSRYWRYVKEEAINCKHDALYFVHDLISIIERDSRGSSHMSVLHDPSIDRESYIIMSKKRK